MEFELLGNKVTINKANTMTSEEKDIVKQATETLLMYQSELEPIKQRMIENEEWYKSRHWEYIRNEKFKDDPEPTTSFVQASVENKIADAVDYYPKPNILPRHEDDVDLAKRLKEIIQVELDWNDFYEVWQRAWYDKVKMGCGIYAVLFDPEGNGGIGSVYPTTIDPLNIICNPHINHIDESRWVFIPKIYDQDEFKADYPDVNPEKVGNVLIPKRYLGSAQPEDMGDKVVVIDGYYFKRNSQGVKNVQFVKFAGEQLLYWSEQDEMYAETGYYECDTYPFEFDQCYEEKDNIFGFGLIDVIKSPQVYIDKLDQIILSNTFAHSRKRHFVKESAGVNLDQFLDPSQDLVTCRNLTDDHIREIKVEPTDASVFNHRHNKIEELKETSSANEFARGETSGGVTAAQAIVALQKASSKTSRSMIAKSYSVISRVMYIYIEHIRQFYDELRSYRVPNPQNPTGYDFVEFNNEGIKPQMLDKLQIQGQEPQFRKPIFDIKVEPEKRDPFSQTAQNELGKELFNLGVFNPQRVLESEVLLEMMDFEGKERVLEQIKNNGKIFEQLMAGQQAQQENMMLKQMVQKLTGQDLGVPMQSMKGANA